MKTMRWIRSGFLFLAWAAMAQTPAAAGGAASRLPAAVTVEVADAQGAPLRAVNGLIVADGVVVQTSALIGGSEARIRSRAGDSWTTRNAIAASPVIGLSLLEISPVPSYAVEYPNSGAFQSGSTVTIIQGPAAGQDSVSATLHYAFSLRDGVDYAPLVPSLPGAAPVFDGTGRFLGVSIDLTAAGIPVGVMIPMASVRTLSAGRGAPLPISQSTPQAVPAFENTESLTGLVFRGAALTAAGSTESARNFLNLALKRSPDSPEAHFWTGRLLFTEQQYDPAAEAFQAAGNADPGYHLAWHMAGAAYNQAGDYLNAEKMYGKALEANPRAADTYCNLGGAYFNQRRYEKAIEAFEKSIEFNPRYANGLAYTNLALTYRSLGKHAEVEKVYERLKTVNADWAARLRAILDGR